MVRNIFLDLDDTILDFHTAEKTALSATLLSLGIPPCEETLRRYSEINAECWKKLESGEYTRYEVLHKRFDFLFEELNLKCDSVKAQDEYEYRLSLEHPFMEGGLELLESLYGKYRLYIASNGTAIVQDRRIADADLGKYFDGIFISQRVGFDKPAREFFEIAFSQIPDFKKEETVILGDSLTSDIRGGINAGITTCYFNPKSKENNSAIIPDYEIKSLSDFTKVLEEL